MDLFFDNNRLHILRFNRAIFIFYSTAIGSIREFSSEFTSSSIPIETTGFVFVFYILLTVIYFIQY
jgi:hypothetical protein